MFFLTKDKNNIYYEEKINNNIIIDKKSKKTFIFRDDVFSPIGNAKNSFYHEKESYPDNNDIFSLNNFSSININLFNDYIEGRGDRGMEVYSRRRYGIYQKSFSIENVILGPPDGNTKIHLFGDIKKFETHWLDNNQIDSTIEKIFESNCKKNKNISFNKNRAYICSKDFFNGSIFDETHKERIRRHMKVINGEDIENPLKKDSWEEVHSPKSKKNKIQNFFNPERVFCLGCSMNNVPSPTFLLTGINVDNNELCYLITTMSFLKKIKEKYEENKEGYENIEQWLYDYDLNVNKTSSSLNNFEKDITIEPLPTKYLNLSGFIFSIKPSFIIDNKSSLENSFSNMYHGDDYFRHLHDKYLNIINVIGFENDTLYFRNLDEKDFYKKVPLKKGQMKNQREPIKKNTFLEL